jgi:ribosomal protein S18 acetylase RimI-like enzyme
MPEIQIRPAAADDILQLTALDHDYTSDFVWQMEVVSDEGRMEVSFRQIRLPRSVKVDYPRSVRSLSTSWEKRAGLLVADLQGKPVGYAAMNIDAVTGTCWFTDMAVLRRVRRQGIGSTLVLAGEEWAFQHGARRIVLEMQPKNHAACSLAAKLGYEFSGYNDRYYANNDTALFFAKLLRG